MIRWIQCVQWQLLFCGQRHKDSSMPNVRSTKVGLICSIKSSALRALRHAEVAIGCQYALLHRLSSKLCDCSKGRAGKCSCCTCTEAALDTACVADSSIAPSLYRLPIVEKVMLRDDPIGNLVATSPPSPWSCVYWLGTATTSCMRKCVRGPRSAKDLVQKKWCWNLLTSFFIFSVVYRVTMRICVSSYTLPWKCFSPAKA